MFNWCNHNASHLIYYEHLQFLSSYLKFSKIVQQITQFLLASNKLVNIVIVT